MPRGDHEHGSGRKVTGPTLHDSLRETGLRVTAAEVSNRVGSNRRWAATVHQGSKPHIIRAKGGKMLKFRWDKGNLMLQQRGRRGRTFFYFKQVRHPGNRKPVKYLMLPLQRSGRAHGFRVRALFASQSL